jgi:hypothetical protein
MSTAWLQTTLTNLYEEALDSLESPIRGCPDELWGASMWEVRLTDRHVWPIVRGMGEDLPDEERLQLHSAFGNIAYHVLFFLDHYLSGGVGTPDPPPPFRGDEQEPHTLPHRMYTRDELLEYLGFCRRKAESVLAGLTEEQLERPARIGWPLGDLLIRNVIQVTDHAAQLSLFLNRAAGWSDPRWTTSDRWFRRCPDCPGEGA